MFGLVALGVILAGLLVMGGGKKKKDSIPTSRNRGVRPGLSKVPTNEPKFEVGDHVRAPVWNTNGTVVKRTWGYPGDVWIYKVAIIDGEANFKETSLIALSSAPEDIKPTIPGVPSSGLPGGPTSAPLYTIGDWLQRVNGVVGQVTDFNWISWAHVAGGWRYILRDDFGAMHTVDEFLLDRLEVTLTGPGGTGPPMLVIPPPPSPPAAGAPPGTGVPARDPRAGP